MATFYNQSSIEHLKNRAIFFDANILIYLFWSIPDDYRSVKYSKIYSHILKSNITKVVDYIVLSEVINRSLRIEYSSFLDNSAEEPTFKEYRDSEEGQSKLADIYMLVEHEILNDFEVAEKSYSKNDLLSFLSINRLDFSDKAIEQICKDSNYILLTHDADFKDSSLEILTVNNKMRG